MGLGVLDVESPSRAGVGAGEALHFAQQEAEVFRVHAVFASGHKAAVFRALQGGLGQGRVHDGEPLLTHAVGVDANVGLRRGVFKVAVGPKLLGVGPQVIERGLRARV